MRDGEELHSSCSQEQVNLLWSSHELKLFLTVLVQQCVDLKQQSSQVAVYCHKVESNSSMSRICALFRSCRGLVVIILLCVMNFANRLCNVVSHYLGKLYYYQTHSSSFLFIYLFVIQEAKIKLLSQNHYETGENTTYFPYRVLKVYMVMLAAVSYQKRSEIGWNFQFHSVMLVNSLLREWDRKLLFMSYAKARDFRLVWGLNVDIFC